MVEAKELTAAAVEKYRPQGERRRIRDAKATSLYLIVETSGRKSWQMRFRRLDGKPGKITLGPVDFSGRELKGDPQIGQPLTLAAARLLAAEVHRRRALGEDVIADHKAAKHRQRVEIEERQESSFGAVARTYMKEKARPKTRNWRSTARLLGLAYGEDDKPEEIRGGLAHRWANKDVRTVSDHDVWQVIEEARTSAVPGIEARNRGTSEARARSLFVALSSLFKWAKGKRDKNGQRLIDRNPCADVQRPAAAKSRDRLLSNDEVRWFWLACDQADAPRVPDAPRPFAPLLRLLLATGQRLDEVGGMTSSELIDDGAMWSLSGDRTKNKLPHVVPLSSLARELIENAKPKPNKAGFLFSTNGETPVSGWSRMKHRLDAAMLAIAREERGADVTIAPWRLHDLRRTAITGMNALAIAPHVVERVVNHVSGPDRAGVAGVYNKYKLLPERTAALAAWARFLPMVIDAKLHAAHKKYLAAGDDATRAAADKAFKASATDGDEAWSRYLATITASNVVTLPRGRLRHE